MSQLKTQQKKMYQLVELNGSHHERQIYLFICEREREREETNLVSVHCMGFCSQSFHMFSPQIQKSSH